MYNMTWNNVLKGLKGGNHVLGEFIAELEPLNLRA